MVLVFCACVDLSVGVTVVTLMNSANVAGVNFCLIWQHQLMVVNSDGIWCLCSLWISVGSRNHDHSPTYM